MVRAAGAQAPHLLHKVGGCLEQGGHLGRGGAGLEGDVEGDEAQAQQQGAGGGCAHGARNPNLRHGRAAQRGEASLQRTLLVQPGKRACRRVRRLAQQRGGSRVHLVQQGKALVLGHAVLPHQSLEQLVVCGQGGGAAGVVHR
jgi:hypothetical protein